MRVELLETGLVPVKRGPRELPHLLPPWGHSEKIVFYEWRRGPSVWFSSVAQSCLMLCKPMDCSMPAFPVHHQFSEFTQTHGHQVGDAIHHLILCPPLLPPPSIFPSIRVFSSESALCVRWPKYWSFSISPSNGYAGLISFRIDWFELLAV